MLVHVQRRCVPPPVFRLLQLSIRALKDDLSCIEVGICPVSAGLAAEHRLVLAIVPMHMPAGGAGLAAVGGRNLHEETAGLLEYLVP